MNDGRRRIRINIRLEEALLAFLRQIAAERGHTVTRIIEDAILVGMTAPTMAKGKQS